MKVPTEFNRKVIEVPASKSDSQRAILAASFVNGEVTINQSGSSKDELAMISNIKSIGAHVIERNHTLEIRGVTEFPKSIKFNCGESGLGSRLISSICLVHEGEFEITGEGSLMERPFNFFRNNFEDEIPAIKDNNGQLPLIINGGFKGGELTVSGKQSSQYISGLLMALPLAENDSILIVEDLSSSPYVEMTLRTLHHFGIVVENQNLKKFIIPGNQEYKASTYQVERDWSSASCWLVASALGKDIWLKDLSMSSLQADKLILDVFISANCTIENENNLLRINGENRTPFQCDLTHSPDLFPALAAFAALSDGKSTLFGLHRLASKESDRGITIQSEFSKIGIEVELDYENDAMLVFGKTSLKGGKVSSHNDHRIAMCLGVLGLFSDSPIEVGNKEAVAKSYPNFWMDITLFSTTKD